MAEKLLHVKGIIIETVKIKKQLVIDLIINLSIYTRLSLVSPLLVLKDKIAAFEELLRPETVNFYKNGIYDSHFE